MRFLLIILFYFFTPLAFCQPPVELINYTTSIHIKNNRLITEKNYLIQVNNPQGDHMGEVSLLYQEDDKLDLLEAYILNKDGKKVHKLKRKEIITRSNFSESTFHEDNMVKEFKLKWHQYPYQIYYSYKTTEKPFLHIANWYPFIRSNIPTRKAVLKVDLPKDYKISINTSGDFHFKKETVKDSYTYYWKAKDLTPVKVENLSPPISELLPKVTIVGKKFMYGAQGSFESWSSFGQWQEKLINNLDILPQKEKDKVDRLIKGISDRKEIIKILYHYMQDNTRYINVSIDIGGLKPYPASYVSTNKYGDCKALTIYMKALLKYAGIGSYYTIIHAGESPVKINTALPSQQFNHVILNIPLGNDTIWLENTANYLPYNYIGTFTQGRYALLVDGQNSRLIKTPSLDMDQVQVKNVYNIQLDKQGNGVVNVRRVLRGKEFDSNKYYQNSYKKEDLTPLIKSYFNLPGFELINFDFDHTDRDKQEMDLLVKLKVQDQFKKYGSTLALKLVPFSEIELEKPEIRKHPLRIPYPYNQSDSIVYDISDFQNHEVSLPEVIEIENRHFIYNQSYKRVGDTLIVTRKFALPAGEYPIEEYAGFYAAMSEIIDANKKSIIILNPQQ